MLKDTINCYLGRFIAYDEYDAGNATSSKNAEKN